MTSVAGPPLRPRMNAKIKLPKPVTYGVTSVPRTVPSMPSSDMHSRHQMVRNEAKRKTPVKIHGAQTPVCSIHVIAECTGWS